MSLRVKLILWYTAVFALSGGLLATALFALITHRMHAEADNFLRDEHAGLAQDTVEKLSDIRGLEVTLRDDLAHGRYFPLVYRLHDAEQHKDLLLLGRGEPPYDLPLASPIAGPVDGFAFSSVALAGGAKPVRLLTGRLHPRLYPHLVLQVGMQTRRLERSVASLQVYLYSTLACIVLAAAAGGWVLASRSLKPIDDIVAELSRIESTNLTARLRVGPSGDEVDRLRGAINRMLERLHAAFDRLQSFTADAAHELRTPIAALRCRLETTVNRPPSEADSRTALTEVLHQATELSTLIDNMLFLARMDAEAGIQNAGPVDLGALLCDIGEPFTLLAEERGLTLTIDCREALLARGDTTLLRRIFGNLLDNAIRYTPAGGRVAARATRRVPGPDGRDGCQVAVADTGIGIRPDALAHVFDRFYRTDESRSRADGGAGLGLSLVKRAIELHHGTIHIESTPGKGTTVTVWLPGALSSAPVPPTSSSRA